MAPRVTVRVDNHVFTPANDADRDHPPLSIVLPLILPFQHVTVEEARHPDEVYAALVDGPLALCLIPREVHR